MTTPEFEVGDQVKLLVTKTISCDPIMPSECFVKLSKGLLGKVCRFISSDDGEFGLYEDEFALVCFIIPGGVIDIYIPKVDLEVLE